MSDIEQHEWSDEDIYCAEHIDSLVRINLKYIDIDIDIDKHDAIALAKHFGLTAEDLK